MTWRSDSSGCCRGRPQWRLRIDAQQHVGLLGRVHVVRHVGGEGEYLAPTQRMARIWSSHVQRAAQHVNGDPPGRLVLWYEPAWLEGKEDEPDRSMMEQRDLPVPSGAGPRLGTQRTECGRQVECTLGTSETIRWVWAATLFWCTHAQLSLG